MDRAGRMAIRLNLRPGPVTLRLAVRGHGFILIRLSEREVASAYVKSSEWRPVPVKIRTSGGKRWLVAELVNGQPKGSAVEVGTVSVEGDKEGG